MYVSLTSSQILKGKVATQGEGGLREYGPLSRGWKSSTEIPLRKTKLKGGNWYRAGGFGNWKVDISQSGALRLSVDVEHIGSHAWRKGRGGVNEGEQCGRADKQGVVCQARKGSTITQQTQWDPQLEDRKGGEWGSKLVGEGFNWHYAMDLLHTPVGQKGIEEEKGGLGVLTSAPRGRFDCKTSPSDKPRKEQIF